MDHIINVSVLRKIAKTESRLPYVCGNSDYVIDFAFDEEWEQYEFKTARFISNGKFVDVVFTGNRCAMPVFSDTYTVTVGVYAGDIKTTTPALIIASKSILCGGGVPAAPEPDVYAQIMELLNTGYSGNYGAENAGKLLYINTDGSAIPLSLGSGLKIINGVLTITDRQAVQAICGTALAGQVKCGEA